MGSQTCSHCGATVFGNVSKCHRCGEALDFARKAAEDRAHEREAELDKAAEDPVRRKRYSTLYRALMEGRAAVLDPEGTAVHSGPQGWRVFAGLGDWLTCLKCRACGFVVVARFQPGVDDFLRRAPGTASADNWEGTFTCTDCGHHNVTVRVSVSHDPHNVHGTKEADPIAEAFPAQGIGAKLQGLFHRSGHQRNP